MRTALLLCSLLTLPGGAVLAAESPWIGTWKFDAGRSHLTGQTLTISKGRGDMLHYEDGSSTSFDFGLDGKEHKTWSNRSSIWTPAGKNAWDVVSKAAGKVIGKGHHVLSEDGKTLTMTFTGTRPDGVAFHEEDVYTRVSGTNGLIGTWRATKVQGPTGPQTFVISSPADGVLHYEIPDMQASVEGRLDGTDHVITGPRVPPGTTISWESVNPTTLKYAIKINGKPDSAGVQTIAPDGRSFTDTSWNAERENEKTRSVYVKQ